MDKPRPLRPRQRGNLHDLEAGTLVVSRDGRSVYEADGDGGVTRRKDLTPEQVTRSGVVAVLLPRSR